MVATSKANSSYSVEPDKIKSIEIFRNESLNNEYEVSKEAQFLINLEFDDRRIKNEDK